MPLASLDDLQAVAHRGAPIEHEGYSELALAQRWEEYRPRSRETLSPFAWTVDDRPYPTLYAAALDSAATGTSIELTLTTPPPLGPDWDYLVPFRSLQFADDGSVELRGLETDVGRTRRAIARAILLEHFVPRSEEQERSTVATTRPPAPFTELLSLGGVLRAVRSTGVVPFSLALLLYLSDERVRIEMDLTDNRFLKDPRSGRLPASRRVVRSPRVAHALDVFVARGELPGTTARALEVLTESSGINAVTLAHVLGSVRELAQGALDTLVGRRLATFDRRTGLYRPRLEALAGPGARASGADPGLPPMPNPQLRSSVMELLAAADSRATCPLCGDPMPAGSRGILCARCQAEVGPAREPAAGGP